MRHHRTRRGALLAAILALATTSATATDTVDPWDEAMRFYSGAEPVDVPILTDPWDQALAYYAGPTQPAEGK